jgi:hypothetical protein
MEFALFISFFFFRLTLQRRQDMAAEQKMGLTSRVPHGETQQAANTSLLAGLTVRPSAALTKRYSA